MKLKDLIRKLTSLHLRHGNLNVDLTVFYPKCPINSEMHDKGTGRILSFETDYSEDKIHTGHGNKEVVINKAKTCFINIEVNDDD